MQPEQDHLIERAHKAYWRTAKARRAAGECVDAPSYSATEVDWADERAPIVILRNSYRVLAEYRWSNSRLRRR